MPPHAVFSPHTVVAQAAEVHAPVALSQPKSHFTLRVVKAQVPASVQPALTNWMELQSSLHVGAGTSQGKMQPPREESLPFVSPGANAWGSPPPPSPPLAPQAAHTNIDIAATNDRVA